MYQNRARKKKKKKMRYCEFSPWYLCENRTDLHNQMTIEFREVTDIANVLYTRVIFNGFSSAAAALNIYELSIYGTYIHSHLKFSFSKRVFKMCF